MLCNYNLGDRKCLKNEILPQFLENKLALEISKNKIIEKYAKIPVKHALSEVYWLLKAHRNARLNNFIRKIYLFNVQKSKHRVKQYQRNK